MLRYVVLKLITIVPTMLILSSVNFILLHLSPGDPVQLLTGQWEPSPELKSRIEKEFGLNEPLYIQYFYFMFNTLRLEFGNSIMFREPVMNVLMSKFVITFALMAMALLFSLGGIALAIIGAWITGRIGQVIASLSTVGYSFPLFWLCQVLMFVFGYSLGVFPLGGLPEYNQGDMWTYILQYIHHLTLPAIALSATQFSIIAKVGRAGLIEALRKPFVVMALSQGLAYRSVVVKHALKDVIPTLVTIIGLRLAYVISGAVIVEYIFSIPGLGGLLVLALAARDYPLALGVLYFFTLLVVLAHFLTDVVHAKLDPRVNV
ncbi:MAG: ABC transporter permease [Candidatus Caldarchaeum sp.]